MIFKDIEISNDEVTDPNDKEKFGMRMVDVIEMSTFDSLQGLREFLEDSIQAIETEKIYCRKYV